MTLVHLCLDPSVTGHLKFKIKCKRLFNYIAAKVEQPIKQYMTTNVVSFHNLLIC